MYKSIRKVVSRITQISDACANPTGDLDVSIDADLLESECSSVTPIVTHTSLVLLHVLLNLPEVYLPPAHALACASTALLLDSIEFSPAGEQESDRALLQLSLLCRSLVNKTASEHPAAFRRLVDARVLDWLITSFIRRYFSSCVVL